MAIGIESIALSGGAFLTIPDSSPLVGGVHVVTIASGIQFHCMMLQKLYMLLTEMGHNMIVLLVDQYYWGVSA